FSFPPPSGRGGEVPGPFPSRRCARPSPNSAIDANAMMRRLPLVLALAALSCAGEPLPPPAPPPPPPTSAPPPPPQPPALRLPGTAAPVRYTATLTIVPSNDTIKGTIDIDLTLAEPTRILWLNATELTVESAGLTRGSQAFAARIVPGGEHF